MYKAIVFLSILSSSLSSISQGLSVSYLIPFSGEIAAPISPFSIRGLGIGDNIGIETGASLYLMPGMNVKNVPFDTQKSIMGSQYSILIPVEFFINLPMNKLNIKLMSGAFFWYSLGAKVNDGNLDRALRKMENWDVLNGNFDFNNSIGKGLLGGLEFEFQVSRTTAVSFQAQYLHGTSELSLRGDYSGGNINSTIQTKTLDLPQSKTLLEGVELSFGVTLLR